MTYEIFHGNTGSDYIVLATEDPDYSFLERIGFQFAGESLPVNLPPTGEEGLMMFPAGSYEHFAPGEEKIFDTAKERIDYTVKASFELMGDILYANGLTPTFSQSPRLQKSLHDHLFRHINLGVDLYVASFHNDIEPDVPYTHEIFMVPTGENLPEGIENTYLGVVPRGITGTFHLTEFALNVHLPLRVVLPHMDPLKPHMQEGLLNEMDYSRLIDDMSFIA